MSVGDKQQLLLMHKELLHSCVLATHKQLCACNTQAVGSHRATFQATLTLIASAGGWPDLHGAKDAL
jgi:hypothetical protein